VFQTKERSPILLCIEVYRPDELNMFVVKQEVKGKKRKSIIQNVSNKMKGQSSSDYMSNIETDAD
jgi:hypothetical protein